MDTNTQGNTNLKINTNHKTNFMKVMEFNRAFDMVSNEPQEYSCYYEDSNKNIHFDPLKNCRTNIFVNSPSTIALRLDLIKEELDELNVAINENDIIEQRDACADILYVVYGMCDILGISIDDYFSSKAEKHVLKYNSENSNSYINSNNYIEKMVELTKNGSIKITNYNYIKAFKNEFLGFYMNSVTNEELLLLIKNNLQLNYMNLELNTILKISDNHTITTKFENISYNLYNLLCWTYMMTIFLGVNADEDFSIVHDSNMSKLCDSEQDASDTVNDYELKYKAGKSPYDSPYYYYLPNLNKWIVKNLSSGKALKNIKYKKVCFANSRFVF